NSLCSIWLLTVCLHRHRRIQCACPAVIADALEPDPEIIRLDRMPFPVQPARRNPIHAIVKLIECTVMMIPEGEGVQRLFDQFPRFSFISIFPQPCSDHIVVIDPKRTSPHISAECRIVHGNARDAERCLEGAAVLQMLPQSSGPILIAYAREQRQE